MIHFLSVYYLILSIWMFCLLVFLCTMCVLHANQNQKTASHLWNWSYRWLLATVCVCWKQNLGPLQDKWYWLLCHCLAPLIYFIRNHWSTWQPRLAITKADASDETHDKYCLLLLSAFNCVLSTLSLSYLINLSFCNNILDPS